MATDAGYWERIKDVARALHSDGCTAVPDLSLTSCCEEHDIHYALGTDVDGREISKWRADWRFLRCMQAGGKTWRERWFVAPFYWLGVTVLGWPFWLRSRRADDEYKQHFRRHEH